mmetsp:Transcript_1546/g.4795  ORF Transcript_1546/g.4795 Transcript_1546/m.4795 type:complete len:206 (+) Transcript_1546:703-1320(+)
MQPWVWIRCKRISAQRACSSEISAGLIFPGTSSYTTTVRSRTWWQTSSGSVSTSSLFFCTLCAGVPCACQQLWNSSALRPLRVGVKGNLGCVGSLLSAVGDGAAVLAAADGTEAEVEAARVSSSLVLISSLMLISSLALIASLMLVDAAAAPRRRLRDAARVSALRGAVALSPRPGCSHCSTISITRAAARAAFRASNTFTRTNS